VKQHRVLIDTNVVLDVLLKRDPWYRSGARIWQAAEEGEIQAFLTASSLTDIHYVARRVAGIERARKSVELCLHAFNIASVDRGVLEVAFRLSGSDFEDDVQLACVKAERLDGIVSRDTAGFQGAGCLVWEPADFVRCLMPPPAMQ
jgi:predicted nucleic acid-binding protein